MTAVHLVDENGAYLCPEAETRDRMNDGESWDHVFNVDALLDPEPDEVPPDVAAEWELEDRLATPCPECGQRGPCAYDADGRALIHVVEDDDA